MDYSVTREELYACNYIESILGYALMLWLRVLNSFIFLFFFLFPFPISFFFSPFTLFLSSYYILWLFYHFLHPRVGQALKVLSFPLLLPFLESSILSCKAACLLFRYHLRINAARELAGQHLMRRQQYPQIFFFSHSYLLSDIFSSTLL